MIDRNNIGIILAIVTSIGMFFNIRSLFLANQDYGRVKEETRGNTSIRARSWCLLAKNLVYQEITFLCMFACSLMITYISFNPLHGDDTFILTRIIIVGMMILLTIRCIADSHSRKVYRDLQEMDDRKNKFTRREDFKK